MPNMKDTKIYRGGAASSYSSLETKECSFDIKQGIGELNLFFCLASKGGGQTAVHLQIGMSDIAAIMEDLANRNPESVRIFAKCAMISSDKLVKELEKAISERIMNKISIRNLLEDLESIEEFVSEKYHAAPNDEDERELALMNQIEEIVRALKSLSSF